MIASSVSAGRLRSVDDAISRRPCASQVDAFNSFSQLIDMQIDKQLVKILEVRSEPYHHNLKSPLVCYEKSIVLTSKANVMGMRSLRSYHEGTLYA